MKVFNLRCPLDHVFEGWFASDAEFEQQKQQGWLRCPMCNSNHISKGLSAPRLTRKSNAVAATTKAQEPAAGTSHGAHAGNLSELQRLQQAWLQFSRHVVANTEDVGEQFATVVRQMHEGEVQERAIRGTATPEEQQSLAEDGIEVVPLLLPASAKHHLQ